MKLQRRALGKPLFGDGERIRMIFWSLLCYKGPDSAVYYSFTWNFLQIANSLIKCQQGAFLEIVAQRIMYTIASLE